MAERGSWALILSSIVMAAAVASSPAAAQAQPSPAIDVTGATYAELDDATGVWTLRGTPVSVRRGALTVQAGSITYDTRAQVLRAAGGVRYDDATMAVTAAEMTAWLAEEHLLATGTPVVTTPEGTLTAERVEVHGRSEQVVAEGNAHLVHEDIDGRASHLLLQRRLATATFSGGAVVRQGPHEVRAQTVIIDLRRRRVTARGAAIITVQIDR